MKTGMSSIKRRLGDTEEIEDMKKADIEEDEFLDECVDTLLKAAEIKQDSQLMEKIWPILQKKKDAAIEITSLDDLRKLAGKKSAEEYDEKIKAKK